MREFYDQLQDGMKNLGLSPHPNGIAKLLDYLSLMVKWNKTYNLTAIREPEKMLTHHLLDSLSVVPHLQGEAIIDIGSGAGLPGIPIALSKPETHVTMLDSNQKKTTFIRQACIQLTLNNASVTSERAENWKPEKNYDVVISRAFSDLATFIQVAGHLCLSGGRMYAMKGTYPHDEISQIPASVNVEQIIPLAVPGLEAERHLVVMRVK